jgi:hypothetical protein
MHCQLSKYEAQPYLPYLFLSGTVLPFIGLRCGGESLTKSCDNGFSLADPRMSVSSDFLTRNVNFQIPVGPRVFFNRSIPPLSP